MKSLRQPSKGVAGRPKEKDDEPLEISAGAILQIALRPSQLRPDIDQWSRRLNANQFLSIEDGIDRNQFDW